MNGRRGELGEEETRNTARQGEEVPHSGKGRTGEKQSCNLSGLNDRMR